MRTCFATLTLLVAVIVFMGGTAQASHYALADVPRLMKPGQVEKLQKASVTTTSELLDKAATGKAATKPLSVSFHFRRADDEAAARAYLTRVEDAARAEGLVPRWGRMVLEVRPPVRADKGTAVAELVRRAAVTHGLYAGDDTTDLDAFAGLDGLELGIRVAVDSPEAPAALLAAADLVVEGTDGVLALLRAL